MVVYSWARLRRDFIIVYIWSFNLFFTEDQYHNLFWLVLKMIVLNLRFVRVLKSIDQGHALRASDYILVFIINQ